VTRVKICGVTRAEDAALAVEAGADALGFIFVPGTPRYIHPDRAAAIIAALPPLVAAVGVFVDQPLDEVLAVASACRLEAVQLHGEESAAYCRRLPIRIIKALRVRGAESLGALEGYPAQAFLLDAFVEGQPGGTGVAFPWALAREAKRHGPIILSGGLRPETVAEAVRRVRPFGVDVSSGVERRPGQKDPEKVREFIVAVRHADLS
jgi:phosphoribosylanthranilate isomerase